MLENIPIYFCDDMVAESESFSPSAMKPRAAVESWRTLGIPMKFDSVVPVTEQELARAHDPQFVSDILACRVKNGFGNTLPAVAHSLPYTNGAMLSAARAAIRNELVAVAPVAGFHHAGYASVEGYCTFNGLMVTALALKEEGVVNRIGILDFDMHYGNGTDEIIGKLGAWRWIDHYTAGKDYCQPIQAAEFLTRIRRIVKSMASCDVILYQAGADPHIADPLGGWLSTLELRVRDRIVFEEAKKLGIPVAWNLAGGYQRDARGSIAPVLEIHDNTMRMCAEVYLPKGSN